MGCVSISTLTLNTMIVNNNKYNIKYYKKHTVYL